VTASDDFLSIVSHELRTPLTSIQGYSQLLEARLRAAPERNAKELAHMDVIRSQVARMRRLVDDLLDVSRIERRGGVSIEPEPMDLAEELREIASRVRREHPERQVAIDLPDALPISADHDRVAQVLGNLIDNALKYSPLGGPIALSAFVDGDEVEVQVADEGLGIPEWQRELVFERFFQADDVSGRRRSTGLGLGLYICRAIVESHGGSIRASENAAVGHGTTITLRLPLVARPSLPPLAIGELPPFVMRASSAPAAPARPEPEPDGSSVPTPEAGA
jgi:signal transduction histidine kinase